MVVGIKIDGPTGVINVWIVAFNEVPTPVVVQKISMSPAMSNSQGMGATAAGTNITVNVSGADPNAVAFAIQEYVRRNGAIPLQTTTKVRF